MNIRIIAGLLSQLGHLRRHDQWTRQTLEAHQADELLRLRAHAVESSPFYRRFHAGLEDRPLHELPVLTKAVLMENFDDLVTDRAIRLDDVRAHIAGGEPGRRYLGRYWASATSGSTGRPGIFLFSRSEWCTVLASFARGHEWAGVGVSLTHRMSMASVASTTPWHMSSQVSESLRSRWMPALRLSATQPVDELVAALNDWQPEMLVTYATMAPLLADEQLAGRLNIAPELVFTSSEVLTSHGARKSELAWGRVPFNEYAATETGGLAAECDKRSGMHLFEDLAIVEVVDEHHRPVPPGAFGDHLLITSLFNRTQPLIRYVLSDRVRLATVDCPCGRPFALIAEVQGRAEDVLHFPTATGGSVTVHPNVFHDLLDSLPINGWQVMQQISGVRVLLGGEGARDADELLAASLRQTLVAIGVALPQVAIERVNSIPRGPGGKAQLIRPLSSPAEEGNEPDTRGQA